MDARFGTLGGRCRRFAGTVREALGRTASAASGAPDARWRRAETPGNVSPRGPYRVQQLHGGLDPLGERAHHDHPTRSARSRPHSAQRLACRRSCARAASSRLSRRADASASPAPNHIVARTRRPPQPSGDSSKPACRRRRCGRAPARRRAVPDCCRKLPRAKALACRWQTQSQHVPADHFGARRKIEAQSVVRQAAAVGDGLQRQPFQPRAVGQLCMHQLLGGVTGAAVEARRAGRGDQRVAAGIEPCLQTAACRRRRCRPAGAPAHGGRCPGLRGTGAAAPAAGRCGGRVPACFRPRGGSAVAGGRARPSLLRIRPRAAASQCRGLPPDGSPSAELRTDLQRCRQN